jgi:hypothetical protein
VEEVVALALEEPEVLEALGELEDPEELALVVVWARALA